MPCELTWPLWFIQKNPPEGFAGEYNPEQCTVTATPSLLLVLGPQELKEVGVDVVTLRESWAWSRDPSSSTFLPSVSHPCPLNPRFLHLGRAADFNLCCTIPFIQPRLWPGAVCQPCLWIVFLCVYFIYECVKCLQKTIPLPLWGKSHTWTVNHSFVRLLASTANHWKSQRMSNGICWAFGKLEKHPRVSPGWQEQLGESHRVIVSFWPTVTLKNSGNHYYLMEPGVTGH